MLILLVGGARSGKSALAVQLGRARREPVVFVATGGATDADMQARIDRHRAERPAAWRTIEEPLDLAAALDLAEARACVIVDCLSIWTASALAAHGSDAVAPAAERFAVAAARRPGLTIAVSNEVGMGVHPVSSLGREYRDLHGRVNAIWSRAAERAFLVVASRLVELAPCEQLFGELA